MGICAQAASSAYESAHDPRIKAVGLVSPSLDGAELAGGTFFLTRWGVYLLGGVVRILYALGINPRITAFPETEAQLANATPMQQGMAGFYAAGKVGSHPRWKNALSMTAFPGIASLHINDHAPKFYGSNWPVCERAGDFYVEGINIVKGYFQEKGEAAYQKYFWQNAQTVYRYASKGEVTP